MTMPRIRLAVVLALACGCAVVLPACGTSDEDEVRAVVKEFRRALQAREGDRACRLLTAHAKSQLGGPCVKEVTSIDPGDPSSDGALTLHDDRASLATHSGGRTRGIGFVKTGDGWRIEGVPVSTAAVEQPARAAFLKRCWRAAGARIAASAQDLAFAAATAEPVTAVRGDSVSAKGGDWRIFYALADSGGDPGLKEVIADPGTAAAVAYVENAAAHPQVVARARACAAS